ncbi:Ig-like domain-containing protein [Deinococcus sp. NW-56]|uniref:Ig-like domain-containing protein n=1 Tax=Deinococcus sp. NW-56 TaxID=2080419 RepID=UPI001319EFB2|nr:Ig-like domain-containing protein [Deinococcus sp. NW-56]
MAPAVRLEASTAVVKTSAPVSLRAEASDEVGVVSVTFYDGTRLLSTDREAPFEAAVSYGAAENGPHTLRAVATDAAGNRGEASAVLTVAVAGAGGADTQPPTVRLSAAPQTLAVPGPVDLTATATDDTGVTGVTFYRGATRLGEDTAAPYTFRDDLTALGAGEWIYRAVASDATGNTAESALTVTVPGSPAGPQGAEVAVVQSSPTSYTVTVKPAPGRLLARVEVYDNGRLVATDEQAPYSTDLTYGAADNGPHTLRIRIVDDRGAVTEVSRSLTVNVVPSADAPPTVGLVPDALTITREDPVTLTATAQDDRGIDRVEFLLDGERVGVDREAPYTVSLSFGAAQGGTRTLTARAYDTAGQTAEARTTLAVAIDAGDFVDRATPVQIGQSIDGVIAGNPRDIDIYRFTGAADDRLRVTVSGSGGPFPNSTLDPYVQVLLPDGKTVFEQDDDSGPGYDAELLFNLPQEGTYYIVVTSFRIFDDPRATDDRPTNLYRLSLSRR